MKKRVPSLDELSREEKVRRYRTAAKVMHLLAAKSPLSSVYYLSRAIEYEKLAEEEEERVGVS